MDAVKKIGFWSSIFTAFFSAFFMAAAITDMLGFLPQPWKTILPIAPSLLLAYCYLVMMICLHFTADKNKKIWSGIGCAFALLYTAFVSIVYVTWLFVVLPKEMTGSESDVSVLLLTPGSFLQMLDGAGYFLMGVATLFGAAIFDRKEKPIKLVFILNGVLSLPILLAFITYNKWLISIGTLWGITMPLVGLLSAKFFKESKQPTKSKAKHSFRTIVKEY